MSRMKLFVLRTENVTVQMNIYSYFSFAWFSSLIPEKLKHWLEDIFTYRALCCLLRLYYQLTNTQPNCFFFSAFSQHSIVPIDSCIGLMVVETSCLKQQSINPQKILVCLVKCRYKQNGMICKSQKTIFHSQYNTGNISNLKSETF